MQEIDVGSKDLGGAAPARKSTVEAPSSNGQPIRKKTATSMMMFDDQRKYYLIFFLISTFWVVGMSGVLKGVVVSITDFVEVDSPLQPLTGATDAHPTSPIIARRNRFRVIKYTPKMADQMKPLRTRT